MITKITQQQILDYEVSNRQWIGYISIGWVQELIGLWLAQKVKKRHARYIKFMNEKELIEEVLFKNDEYPEFHETSDI